MTTHHHPVAPAGDGISWRHNPITTARDDMTTHHPVAPAGDGMPWRYKSVVTAGTGHKGVTTRCHRRSRNRRFPPHSSRGVGRFPHVDRE